MTPPALPLNWERLADRMATFAKLNAGQVDLATDEGMRLALASSLQPADHADMLWDWNDPEYSHESLCDMCDGYDPSDVVQVQTAFSAPNCFAAYVPEDLPGFLADRAEKGDDFDPSEHDFQWTLYGCEHAAREARNQAMGDAQ